VKTLSMLCVIVLLLSSPTISQVRDNPKMPDSGSGCVDVVKKLQNLTVGRMRVKTCCNGVTLIAHVKEESSPNGKKKRVQGWEVVNAAGDSLEADKGPSYSSSSRTTNLIIRTTNGAACFIIEKNVRP
jgi:hypothetical protein